MFVVGQDDIALVICMVVLMSLTGGIVMFKVNMRVVVTTESGPVQDLRDQSINAEIPHESLSSRENSQNKLVLISKMIFLPAHHGVREGFKIEEAWVFSFSLGNQNNIS